MKQGKRRRETGLAIAARKNHHNGADDARSVRMAGAVNAPDYPLLPVVKLESVAGKRVLRMLEGAQKFDRSVPVAVRVFDLGAVENPVGIGRRLFLFLDEDRHRS